MKKHLLIIATTIIGLTLASCTIHIDNDSSGETIKGNGNVVTRNYEVTDFNEISAALPATINFTVGDAYTCTVRVD